MAQAPSEDKEPKVQNVEAGVSRASKKGKRKRKSTGEDVSPEEQERRSIQKQKRELALQLRSEGKKYAPQKKSRPPKSVRQAAKDGKPRPSKPKADDSRSSRRDQHAGPVAEPGSGKLVKPGQVEVIVVPLFWKQREAEREAITNAAQEVKKQYDAAGVSSFVDFSNKLNPGQKYRYWEERGVKVRVELGPKDLETSSCVLAICTKPGEVANKSTVSFVGDLLLQTGKALGRDLTLEGSGYVAEPFKKPTEAPKAKHMSFGEEDGAGAGAGVGDGLGLVGQEELDTRRGGDDLGDDFLLADNKPKKKRQLAFIR